MIHWKLPRDRNRVTPRLSDVSIRKAKASSKPQKLTDRRGLYLLLTPGGQRWWRFKYRYAGKEKLLSLGVYPDVPLKQARKKCEEVRKLVAAGIDPSAARQAEKRAVREAADNDFASVAREWLESIKADWSPQHYSASLKRFETFLFSRGSAIARSARSTRLNFLPRCGALRRGGPSVGAQDSARLRAGVPLRRCRRTLRPQAGRRSSGRAENQAEG